MSNQPTLEDKALALAALEAGVYAVPQSGRYCPTVADMMSPIGRILTVQSALYDSPVWALSAAARTLGLEPDKQVAQFLELAKELAANWLRIDGGVQDSFVRAALTERTRELEDLLNKGNG